MSLIANIHIAELTKWSFFDYVQTYPIIPQTKDFHAAMEAIKFSSTAARVAIAFQ